MKKHIVMFCLLALLLSGCTKAPAEAAPSEVLETQPEAVPVTLYEAGSETEKATDGAVRTYGLGDVSHTALIPLGNQLMVVSGEGTLTLLQGDDGQVVATAHTELSAAWSAEDLFVGKQSVAYYVAEQQEVVILDHTLQPLHRVPLPEDVQGKPIVLLNQGEIFYCTTGQVRALDVQSGVSRLVRSHACMSQELVGSYFDETLIGCRIVDEEGIEGILYLDAQTGQEYAEDLQLRQLSTYGQWYYAVGSENGSRQCLFGSAFPGEMLLNAEEETLTPVLPASGVVGTNITEAGMQLAMYDLTSGLRSAEVLLPGVEAGSIAATDDGYIWILSGQKLYRWDSAKSLTNETTVYTEMFYTQQSPDTEGLELCVQKADELSKAYGFTLRVWEKAAEKGKVYGAEAEYRVPETQQFLLQAEQILQAMPADFMTVTGKVQVNLVKSLDSGADRVLHWEDGTCHIWITTGETAVEAFLWGVGNAVDTRILGNSFDYDKWDDLNPWWFDYTYDYEKNLNRDDPNSLLEGSNRYFTDLVAMSYPTEDRSRLFANAMLEDNAEMFESSAMQKKLRSVCIALREAYDWQKVTEPFLWEQYLSKPIAAKK